MVYKIIYATSARKFLKKLPKETEARILRYLLKVVDNPFSFGSPLTGDLAGHWRYRVQDYRVVCKIIQRQLVITVVKIGHRCNVYEDA